MRIIFFGTPEFAVPSLQALLAAGMDVAAVVTQPDRPRGRSHSTLLPSPVKAAALAAGIPVLQPERPRGDEFLDQLRAYDADIGVVVAYGHLLRPDVLAIPRLGLVNVHASLLPRWRGAAPIHWAVLSGDRETGVAIMRLEEGLDTGAVWHTRRTPIRDQDTTGGLFDRLSHLGAEALVEALPRIAAGEAPVPQSTEGVTLAPKVDRETARVVWNAPRQRVSCQIRAMDPFPGAWTTLGGKTIKLYGPTPYSPVESDFAAVDPGTLRSFDEALCVACQDGWLQVAEIVEAGASRMPATRWYRGAAPQALARFS